MRIATISFGKRKLKAIICKDPIRKFIGLMFSRRKNVLFSFDKECVVSLHMFFVFYSIGVLFINSRNVVVEKVLLRPFTVYTPKSKAKYVLEIGEKKSLNLFRRVNIGQRIELKGL